MAEAKRGSTCSDISTKSKADGQAPSAWRSWASIRPGRLSPQMSLAGNCHGKRLASAQYSSQAFTRAQRLIIVKAKVISFTDLAGHERYLRTTVFGLLSSSPNYCLLMVAANNGLIGMSKYGIFHSRNGDLGLTRTQRTSRNRPRLECPSNGSNHQNRYLPTPNSSANHHPAYPHSQITRRPQNPYFHQEPRRYHRNRHPIRQSAHLPRLPSFKCHR